MSPQIGVMSFGFKYGLPLDADIVLDVRFLPNPYFTEGLRTLSGLDEPVRQYVLQAPIAQAFIRHMKDLLLFAIPHYQQEGRHYLTVAIGCTGGRHRSVALASEIADMLRTAGLSVDLSHRDIGEDTR